MIYYIGQDLFPEFPLATIEEALEYLSQQEVIGLDIETGRKYPKNRYNEKIYKPGLDPKLTKIIMLQIGTLERQYVIDARCKDIRKLKKVLEDPKKEKVIHNAQFEGSHLLELGIRLQNVWDTMIVEKILYNGFQHSYSLAAMAERYLGAKNVKDLTLFNPPHSQITKKVKKLYDISTLQNSKQSYEDIYEQVEEEYLSDLIDKSTRMEFVNWGDKPFKKRHIEYGARDITDALKIAYKQKEGREVNGKRYYPIKGILLENAVTQVLAESSWRGVKVDPVKWRNTYEKNLKIYHERKEALNKYVEDNHLEFCGTMDLWSLTPKCAIQWSSSKQVIEYFKWLGFCPKERSKSTKKQEYTVGAKALTKFLKGEHKINFFKQRFPEIVCNQTLVLAYLLYKKSEQLVTTFGLEWLEHIHPITGRVHTRYNQYMISSRLSSVNPNLQQIPGIEDFRGCFVGRFLNCDFSGQELRIAAEVHDVQKMIDFFVKGDDYFGDDFHSFSATQVQRQLRGDPNYIVPPKEINGEPNPEFTKEHNNERSDSKNVTFKINYGGSAYTLSQEFGITLEEAEKYIHNFFMGLPGLKESHTRKKLHALKTGWIEIDSWSGKRYFFPDLDRLQSLIDEVEALKPPGYDNLSKEKREIVKKHLRETTNWTQLWSEIGSIRGKLERRGLNIPIQGNAATMTKIAILKIYNWRWKNNVQDEFTVPLYVHDEIVGETTNKSREKEYANIISKAMVEAGKVTCPRVPQVANPVISDHWQH